LEGSDPTGQIEYRGHILKQIYIPDFVVYGMIILEIKAVSQIASEHQAQVLNYLYATKYGLGLLVNFGHYPKVEFKRMLRR
jgi:GxxExxY protein